MIKIYIINIEDHTIDIGIIKLGPTLCRQLHLSSQMTCFIIFPDM